MGSQRYGSRVGTFWSHIWSRSPRALVLDFDLSRDLDHPVWREIQPIHDFCRVAVQKRKKSNAPARQCRALGLAHNEIAGSNKQSLVEINTILAKLKLLASRS